MSDPDLKSVANPFDFANPVSRRDLFVGREQELRDIRYYLDHAKTAARSINIALLGARAAGKTSLLNIVDLEARDRNLIPVRIDLNESDAESHMAFCFKLFDSLLGTLVYESTAAATDGTPLCFGGPRGKTYELYLGAVSAYEVPADNTFCPFLFPIQYAKAAAQSNHSARVSDQILKRDLQRLAEEAGRPIVVLFDECNVLSAHRSLLELVEQLSNVVS